MAVIENHPIRQRRLRAGLTQQQLAAQAGISRATVCQIEEGRTIAMNDKVIRVLAEATHVPPATVAEEYLSWRDEDVVALLPPRAQNALALPPHVVKRYPSWKVWRNDIASNPTKFASLLRVPRSTVVKYEHSHNDEALPKSIVNALATHFGLSDEYIDALRNLDVE